MIRVSVGTLAALAATIDRDGIGAILIGARLDWLAFSLAVAVPAFQQVDVSNELAFANSVAFALVLTLSALPGALLPLVRAGAARARMRRSDG